MNPAPFCFSTDWVFSWQDPVHYWKAGPGVIMTVEKQNINLSPLKFEFNMVMM